MPRKSIAEIMTLAQRGAGIKVSASVYNASEITTLAQYVKPGCYLIVTDASGASTAALSSILSQAKCQIIFDYT